MKSTARNFKKAAEKDDGSCKFSTLGCMDKKAKNYDKGA
jgi:hypothetical protein